MSSLSTLLALAPSTLGCGYILYPERRGNRGGTIDGGTLVMDCLWLLVFIVPGVVFLIVDFTSGAMYVGGRGSVSIASNGKMKLDLEDVQEAKRIKVRVVNAKGEQLDEAIADVGPTVHGRSLELDVASARANGKREKLMIQVFDATQPDTLLQSVQVL